MEEKKLERFIIRHNSKFRMRWDLFIIVLVLYNCVLIPFQLAFSGQYDSTPSDDFGYIVDLMFVFDVIFNFRTTYINSKLGIEVTKGKDIAKNYMKSWRFYFDTVSVMPFELLYELFVGDSSGNLKMFDLMKLIRLLRLGRIITYLKFKTDIKVGIRLVYLMIGLLILVHWVGCLWYIVVMET